MLFILGAAGYLYYKFVIEVPLLISEKDRSSMQIMPLPAELRLTGGSYKLTSDFGISFTEIKTQRLELAVDRFLLKLKSKTGINFNPGGSVLQIICHAENPKFPELRDDESYSLKVTSNNPIRRLRVCLASTQPVSQPLVSQ